MVDVADVAAGRRRRQFGRWRARPDTAGKHGSGPILEACARTLPPDLRDSAFALAADLVLADGRVEEREKANLDQLQKVLGIDDATAVKIVEVMVIKNRT